MILEKGEMWSWWGETDLWLFTGNSCKNQKKESVMGAGLALEVKKRFPHLPAIIGAYLTHLSTYGLMIPPYWKEESTKQIGVFQVKHHFKNKAELALIGYSVVRLQQYIKTWGLDRVDLNFPGIGYGGLKRDHVLPIIEELPDCVHVWEKE